MRSTSFAPIAALLLILSACASDGVRRPECEGEDKLVEPFVLTVADLGDCTGRGAMSFEFAVFATDYGVCRATRGVTPGSSEATAIASQLLCPDLVEWVRSSSQDPSTVARWGCRTKNFAAAGALACQQPTLRARKPTAARRRRPSN